MYKRQDLVNAVSLNSSLFNGARVVGPAVAGYLIAQVGMAMCFFLNGISFLAVLAGLMLMRLPAFVPPAAPESTWQHALEGFAYVAKHRQVRTLLLLVAIVGVFGWSYSVLLPAFATDVLRVGSREYGMLLSSNGVGAFCGALVVATYGRRLPLPRMIFGGLGFFALMLLLLAATQNYYVALVFMGGAGWGMLLYLSTSNTVVQTSVADGMRGRVMGIWTLMFGGMMPKGTRKLGLSKMNMAGIGAPMMRKACKAAGGMSLEELFASARENDVKFVACTLSMDILGFTKEEMIDGLDYAGVAAYLGEADEANVNLFI